MSAPTVPPASLTSSRHSYPSMSARQNYPHRQSSQPAIRSNTSVQTSQSRALGPCSIPEDSETSSKSVVVVGYNQWVRDKIKKPSPILVATIRLLCHHPRTCFLQIATEINIHKLRIRNTPLHAIRPGIPLEPVQSSTHKKLHLQASICNTHQFIMRPHLHYQMFQLPMYLRVVLGPFALYQFSFSFFSFS